MNIIPSLRSEEKFLPPAEARAKYLAETDRMHDKFRESDHAQRKDFFRQKGEVIHSSELIRRLIQIEPRLIVRQSNFPDDWGLYIQYRDKMVFISQVSKGWMTEWSYIFVDEHDIPDHAKMPKWGWRTVLLRMMLKGVMSWRQIESAFGDSRNANSERWLRLTEPFRHSHYTGTVQASIANHF